jgi:hypothetical protein
MARTLEIKFLTGLSVTVELVARGANAITETITMTEKTVAKQIYTGTIASAGAGFYDIAVKSGSDYVGTDDVRIETTDPLVYRAGTIVGELRSYALDQIDGLLSGSGTGPHTVTLTVTDDADDPIEGAKVGLSRVGDARSGTTDVDGQVQFSVDAATWTVAITAVGFVFTPETLVVDGDETETYVMTTVSITPPGSPLLTTGFLVCYGTDGNVKPDVKVRFRLKAGPGDPAYALDGAEFHILSDDAGLVEVPLFQDSTYVGRAGTGPEVSFTTGTDPTYEIPELLGRPF